jgi:hypothetical protein
MIHKPKLDQKLYQGSCLNDVRICKRARTGFLSFAIIRVFMCAIASSGTAGPFSHSSAFRFRRRLCESLAEMKCMGAKLQGPEVPVHSYQQVGQPRVAYCRIHSSLDNSAGPWITWCTPLAGC